MSDLDTQIVADYKCGKPIKMIARENKISEHLAYKILASAGITDATQTAQIVSRMYAEGSSVGTIARELKIGRNAVEKYLPYTSSPRRTWAAEEDEIVLSGGTPNGRTQEAANIRRHRLKKSPSPAQWAESPLRSKRMAERLTQAELARMADVPVATIRAYEQGSRDISSASIDIIDRLSAVLHCDYREILPKKA